MLPRLYAILDVELTRARGVEPRRVLDDWLDAGVRLIQLRAKHETFGPLVTMADDLAGECRRAGALFIVNDRIDVAALVGAAGVHLGQGDLSPAEARAMLVGDPLIGLSTHTDAQMAAALESAATYLAVGPVFETSTKEKPDPAIGLEGVRRLTLMAKASGRPVVAIGGITLDTAPAVLDAGADSVAVVSDLLSHLDDAGVASRARAFMRALA